MQELDRGTFFAFALELIGFAQRFALFGKILGDRRTWAGLAHSSGKLRVAVVTFLADLAGFSVRVF